MIYDHADVSTGVSIVPSLGGERAALAATESPNRDRKRVNKWSDLWE